MISSGYNRMMQRRDAALAYVLGCCDAMHNRSSATLRHRYQDRDASNRALERGAPHMSVHKRDTLAVALELREAGKDVMVLIFADAERPGGCVHGGAGMQEESLFRRTALFAHLTPDLYPIDAQDELLYAGAVDVLLREEDPSTKVQGGVKLAFVACPGLKMPPLVAGHTRFLDEDAIVLTRKVDTILQTACRHGHDAVVLGALGCGVFGGPVRHTAEIFRSCVDASRCCVNEVHFAVLGAAHSVFLDVMSCPAKIVENSKQPCVSDPHVTPSHMMATSEVEAKVEKEVEVSSLQRSDRRSQ